MVIDGNTAKLSGVMISSTDSPDMIGKGIFFKVWDNGEGTVSSANDIISLVFIDLYVPVNCAIFTPPLSGFTYTIDGGNVQVRP